MKTSIYISTDMVKVISYTKSGSHVRIKDYLCYPLPEECMLSGVILDGAPILKALYTLKAKEPHLFSDASLVIDGNFVYTKKITVPNKLNKISCDEVIRDEFSEVSTDSENLICDHFYLSNMPDGSKSILACAVENVHVQSYISLFNAAKINLTSIHLGIFTVLQFINRTTELCDKPFVLNVIDDLVMLSMIFQNGVNVFQSRTRLYGDDQTAIVNSTLDGLSGIIQFNKSQNFQDITDCYYLGLSDSDMELISQNSSYPEIRFSKLDLYSNAKNAKILPPNAHFAYLNTLMQDSDNDIFYNMKMLEKAKQKKRPKKVWVPTLICASVFLAILLTFMWVLVSNVERDIRDIKNYIDDPNIVAERNRLDEFSMSTSHITTLYDSIVNMQSENSGKYRIDKQTLNTLASTAGIPVYIKSFNFDYSSGTISVTCSSSTEYDASNFVESLRINPMFADFDVYYTGYTTGAEGTFIFSIDIVQRSLES